MKRTTPVTHVNGAHEVPPGLKDLPRHVAIIMDGNGRWAVQRHLPRHAGHRAGTRNIRKIVEEFALRGIPYLTLYAFSTENWSRPSREVEALLSILEQVIDEQAQALHHEGVRLLHLGRLDRLSPSLQKAIKRALDLTKDNTRLTLSVAFDYGGRDEILEAIRRMIADGVTASKVDEDLVQRYLYTCSLPDPDLIIRTAGEQRLSNFLVWQSAYSEYYCTPVFWPDFGKPEVSSALAAYQQRQRRFGGVPQRGGPCRPPVRS